MQVQRAFTVKYPARVNVLKTTVGVFSPVSKEEAEATRPPVVQAIAIWDTGATGTVITRKIADVLGLQPIGMKEIAHAAGTSVMNEYLVNIALPNKVVIPSVRVTEGDLRGAEVLIGMNIIARGDFAVTHVNEHGGTTMSFCMPSSEEIDFLPRAQEDEIMKTGNRAARRAIERKRK
jgi:predicted aspartyl protease